MNIGKLYQIKKYFWLLYPSKETVEAASAAAFAKVAAQSIGGGVEWSDYLSQEFNCNVTFIPPNSIFCLLEEDGNFLKILSTNGELGWMVYPRKEQWTKGCIEEVKE